MDARKTKGWNTWSSQGANNTLLLMPRSLDSSYSLNYRIVLNDLCLSSSLTLPLPSPHGWISYFAFHWLRKGAEVIQSLLGSSQIGVKDWTIGHSSKECTNMPSRDESRDETWFWCQFDLWSLWRTNFLCSVAWYLRECDCKGRKAGEERG